MAIELQEQIRTDYIEDPLLQERHIRLGILRLDRIHPLVSGNKWFKLKENISAAQDAGKDTLLSFGGAWSNHLLAMAAAAQASGLRSVGVIRGFHGQQQLSATLQQCMTLGMELVFVGREEYAQKEDVAYLAVLQQRYPGAWIVPEGGHNEQGLAGAGAIAGHIPAAATIVALPIGTGTTFGGIRRRLDNHIAMIGFPVMKGGDYLQPQLAAWAGPAQHNWTLETGFHFGGFARHTEDLLAFMNGFYTKHHIPLDFVYTAKMIYGTAQLIREGEVPEGSHIICIHTGGLQGNRSVQDKLCYAYP